MLSLGNFVDFVRVDQADNNRRYALRAIFFCYLNPFFGPSYSPGRICIKRYTQLVKVVHYESLWKYGF